MSSGIRKKKWMELKNLLEAINFLFDSEEIHSIPFSVDLAKKNHSIIGKDVISDIGVFRSRKVGASASRVMYAIPSTIENRLNTLFDFIKKQMDMCRDLKESLKIATLFFSEYLLIHPFIDGNGRTARLLLNVLLCGKVIIPFTPNSTAREEYIRVLEKRIDSSPPDDLAMYLLQSVNTVASQVKWILLD